MGGGPRITWVLGPLPTSPRAVTPGVGAVRPRPPPPACEFHGHPAPCPAGGYGAPEPVSLRSAAPAPGISPLFRDGGPSPRWMLKNILADIWPLIASGTYRSMGSCAVICPCPMFTFSPGFLPVPQCGGPVPAYSPPRVSLGYPLPSASPAGFRGLPTAQADLALSCLRFGSSLGSRAV